MVNHGKNFKIWTYKLLWILLYNTKYKDLDVKGWTRSVYKFWTKLFWNGNRKLLWFI